MSKEYAQNAYEIPDGNYVFHHLSLKERPSGLILAKHISSISLVSPIRTADLARSIGLVFEQEADVFDQIQRIHPDSKSTRYSVGSAAPDTFIQLGVAALVQAYALRTYHGINPRVEFTSTQERGVIEPDDQRIMEGFAVALDQQLNNRTPLTSDSNTGQYL